MKRNEPTTKPPRRTGRPKRGDSPKIPWPTVDRALVHGERHTDPETGVESHSYPSLADLAERYGVSRSLMWKFAHKSNVYERRKEARTKTLERADEKVIEKLSHQRANAAVNVVGIVDHFLLAFEKELREGRVKTDSAADFDRLTRLRELLSGGADARTELQGGISLAAIQARHLRQRSLAERLTPEVTGSGDVAESELADDAPAPSSTPMTAELDREVEPHTTATELDNELDDEETGQ